MDKNRRVMAIRAKKKNRKVLQQKKIHQQSSGSGGGSSGGGTGNTTSNKDRGSSPRGRDNNHSRLDDASSNIKLLSGQTGSGSKDIIP